MLEREPIAWSLLLALASGPSAAEVGASSSEMLAFNCFTCHGTDGKSPSVIPSLQGRSAAYLIGKLTEFKDGKGKATIMDRIAKGYTAEELARIAEYLSRLK